MRRGITKTRQKVDPVPMHCASSYSVSCSLLRCGTRQKQKRTFLKTENKNRNPNHITNTYANSTINLFAVKFANRDTREEKEVKRHTISSTTFDTRRRRSGKDFARPKHNATEE